ncbi:glyceraldehyde-3-phosphate dehydrogenase [Vicingaceae bacterium]|nr:glyceraldehyde-3-phosphate dehydrogenase [Vicingaceae bacterium]
MEVLNNKVAYENKLNDYVKNEKAAVSLISSIGHLMYEKSIELVLFRNPLVDKSISEILKLHNKAKSITYNPVNIHDTAALAKEIIELSIAPSKLDIGKLASEWNLEKDNFSSQSDFLTNKLSGFDNSNDHNLTPKDVVLYGFGRIGRLAARELIKQAGKGQQLRLRAIVTRSVTEDILIKRAALLMNDSVHGEFNGNVDVDVENNALIINGQIVKFIEAKNPEDTDYTSYGINDALIIDNTGVFSDKEALSRHMQAKGVSKVLLTAPGKGIPNIVYGINEGELDLEKEDIFSAASCTTNAIAPILYTIENTLGVVKGHIETVHAYTNDQNLLDNMHKKPRRGRSAAINMVITSTGAGNAVTKVVPSLKDKLTANAVRVPTPNGSLAILNLNVDKETSVEAINEIIRNAALQGSLVNQIKYENDPELVSNDIIGNICCSVFDSNATIVSNDKKNIVLYVWYDNEFGYTKQVIRLAKYIAKVRRLIYY